MARRAGRVYSYLQFQKGMALVPFWSEKRIWMLTITVGHVLPDRSAVYLVKTKG